MHKKVKKKNGFDIAFDSALQGGFVSATEAALEGRSDGTPQSPFRDIYKDLPEGFFEVELTVVLRLKLSCS